MIKRGQVTMDGIGVKLTLFTFTIWRTRWGVALVRKDPRDD